MRNRFFLIVLALVLAVVGFTAPLQAADIAYTTLSSAMAANSNTLRVTSATGFTASTGTVQYAVYVDREPMLITGVNGTTITVNRSALGGTASAHASGAYAFVGAVASTNATGNPTGGPFTYNSPVGSCTRTSNATLPLINIRTGEMIDCNGGVYVTATLPNANSQQALIKACTVPIGSVAYGSFGTSTTTSATAQYTANVFVPRTIISTGFTNLNGSAVDGGSKKIFILYTSDGKLLANTATAGTLASGNDAFQAIAWTAPRVIPGPAWYLVALQDDTADVNGIRTIAASTFNGVIAGTTTSVFGTVESSITAPTTFTADQGPIGCLY